MFGLGFGEILIILVVALILLGPQRLPDVAKQLGKGLREFKRATDDLKGQFQAELYSDATRPTPRPTLVPPTPAAPPTPQPTEPAPPATPENVAGLEAAPVEPVRTTELGAAAPTTPASAPPDEPVKPA